MNKAELVAQIAAEVGISNAAVAETLDAIIESIKDAVRKGDSVTLVGFGTFRQGKRTARTGRNPRTGDAIKISASKTISFSASASFKALVSGPPTGGGGPGGKE